MELHEVSGKSIRQFALPSWAVWSILCVAVAGSFYGGVLLTNIQSDAKQSREALVVLASDMKSTARDAADAKIVAAEAMRIAAENQRETALIKAWAQGTVGKPLNQAEGR